MLFNLKKSAEAVLSEHDPFDYEIMGREDQIQVEAYDEDIFVARFGLMLFPANPHYVIAWGVRVQEDFQGRGIGQELLDLRMEIAEKAGAHTWLSTINWENEPQLHIMGKYDCEAISGSEEDENDTGLFRKKLQPDFREAVPA